MGLRDALEGKQRRTITVPVQVTDASGDYDTLVGVSTAQQLAHHNGDTTAADALLAQLEEAAAAYRAHWVDVVLVSLEPSDWDAAVSNWHDGEKWNWAQALAPLLAESCVAEELKDEAWWREQLQRPEWSYGDIGALKQGLLRLNVMAVEPGFPKG